MANGVYKYFSNKKKAKRRAAEAERKAKARRDAWLQGLKVVSARDARNALELSIENQTYIDAQKAATVSADGAGNQSLVGQSVSGFDREVKTVTAQQKVSNNPVPAGPIEREKRLRRIMGHVLNPETKPVPIRQKQDRSTNRFQNKSSAPPRVW